MSVEQADVRTDVRVLNGDTELSFSDEGASFVQSVRIFLRDAERDAVTHVVFVSSAMVYGAWENNSIPLFESEPIRPNPGCAIVQAFASGEALVDQWRRGGADRTATILRPVPVVDRRGTSPWVTALAHAAGSEMATLTSGAQFVDADDLRAAINVCARERYDGVVNVAPDGHIPSDRLRALAANPLRVRLPAPARSLVDAARWNLERGPIPPGIRDYVRHSWVVSNDKLKSFGWSARLSNEEAYVAGTDGSVLDGLSARRRQELALVGASALIVGVALISRSLVRRMRVRRVR